MTDGARSGSDGNWRNGPSSRLRLMARVAIATSVIGHLSLVIRHRSNDQ
jgi:hypothetical protein